MRLSHQRFLQVLAVLFAVLWAALAIHPRHRQDWALENVLVLVFIAVLAVSHRRLRLSRLSYGAIFTFLCLHEAGAHYTYAEVPYDAWFSAVTGKPLGEWLGWQRNHFDRVTHFAYGLLLAYPVREVFLRVAAVRGFWGYFLPLDLTMSTSMLFELFEWIAAEIFGGELGVAYLGAQGDVWDAHKDMALASLGALVSMGLTAAVNARLRRDFAREWVESLRVKQAEPLGEVELERLRWERASVSTRPVPQTSGTGTARLDSLEPPIPGLPVKKLTAGQGLSLAIAALTIAVSICGLAVPGLYRDNSLVASGWRGNDAVTLLVATAVLIPAIVLARRGSLRAHLVWMGLLYFITYNFAFYLFGAAYNRLFLGYAALCTLSAFALIFGLRALNIHQVSARFRASASVRWASCYMVLVALGLGGVHLSQWLHYVLTGELPPILARLGHPTNVISALDLSMVVSVQALGAVWLWKCDPRGGVAAVIANVHGAAYMLALSAATVSAFMEGAANELTLLAVWAGIGSGCLACAVLLLSKFNGSARVPETEGT